MQFPLKKLNIEFPHEKLCPKLYKAHAPAKAVKALDEMRVTSGGTRIEEEVVATGKAYGNTKVTTALFKKRAYPHLTVLLFTRGEKLEKIRFAKTIWRPKVVVSWKGKTMEFSPRSMDVREWKL